MQPRSPFRKILPAIACLGLFSMGFKTCDEDWEDFLVQLMTLGAGIEAPVKPMAADPVGVDGIHLIAAGVGGKVLTTTGRSGGTWVERASGTTEDLNFIRLWQKSDTGVVFAAGNRGTLLRSENWGESWAALNSGTTSNLYGYDYYDRFSVIVVGDSGTILWATGAGDTVQRLNSGSTRKLTSIVVNDGYIFIVVGEKGAILRTTNYGQTWEDHSLSDTTVNFSRTARYGYVGYGGRFWAIADQGRVFSTYDGTLWTEQNSGTSADLNDVFFRDVSTGGIVGDGGVMRYTTNGGTTWVSDPYLDSLTTQDIRALARVDDSTYSVLTPGGVLTVSSLPLTDVVPPPAVPEGFALGQNYPNPFNPTTNIRFQISDYGFVTLRLFDISGREVATIVDEPLPPGSYERMFDGAGLGSGVYLVSTDGRRPHRREEIRPA